LSLKKKGAIEKKKNEGGNERVHFKKAKGKKRGTHSQGTLLRNSIGGVAKVGDESVMKEKRKMLVLINFS